MVSPPKVTVYMYQVVSPKGKELTDAKHGKRLKTMSVTTAVSRGKQPRVHCPKCGKVYLQGTVGTRVAYLEMRTVHGVYVLPKFKTGEWIRF